MKKCFLLFLLLLEGLCFAEGKVYITASDVKNFPSFNVIVASGDVSLRYSGIMVYAKEIIYDYSSKRVMLIGNVKIVDSAKESIVYANWADMNLLKKTFSAYEARGVLGSSYYFKAYKIEKISEKEYVIYKGSFSTCNLLCCTPFWKIDVRKLKITVDDRVKGYGVLARLWKIPVFYSPFLGFSISKKRKTGFLMPKAGYNSELGGFLKIPFMLVLGENSDVVFYLVPYTSGIIRYSAKYEYVKDSSNIRLDYDYIYKSQNFSSFKVKAKTSRDRWSLLALGVFDSDIYYRKHYEEDDFLASRNITENYIFLSYSNEPFMASMSVSDYKLEYPRQKRLNVPDFYLFYGPFRLVDSVFSNLKFRAYYDAYSDNGDYSYFYEIYKIFKVGKYVSINTGLLSDNGSLDFSLKSDGPILSKDFGPVRHIVFPEIEYLYFEEKGALSLVNRFLHMGINREFLSLKIKQNFYFDKLSRTNIYMSFHPYSFLSGFSNISMDKFVVEESSNGVNVEFNVFNIRTNLNVSYYFSRENSERFFTLFPVLFIKKRLKVGFGLKRNLISDRTVEQKVFLEILKKCWSLRISYKKIQNQTTLVAYIKFLSL